MFLTAIYPDFGSIGFAAGFIVFYVVMLFVSVALAITQYVLSSLGMYQIAKRRGIPNPWLAWLPVGQAWILGSISDHYQYVAKGKQRNYRKILMGLEIGVLCLGLVTSLVSGAASFTTSMYGFSGMEAAALGMAFQIRDDMLDVIGTQEEMGKGVGTDAAKNTFVRLYGLEKCEELVQTYTKYAIDALDVFENTEYMVALAKSLTDRRV